jgi:hypothetical protein
MHGLKRGGTRLQPESQQRNGAASKLLHTLVIDHVDLQVLLQSANARHQPVELIARFPFWPRSLATRRRGQFDIAKTRASPHTIMHRAITHRRIRLIAN